MVLDTVTNGTFFLNDNGGGDVDTRTSPENGGVSAAGVDDGYLQLADPDESSVNGEDSILTGPEAVEFVDWLLVLKKDRKVFVMLHREMKLRQQAQTTASEQERYAKTLRNFDRLQKLFRQKKVEIQAPGDGMTLLDWAQKILDRFKDEDT